MGISNRYKENSDLFINITFSFKSSEKEFKGSCIVKDSKFILKFFLESCFYSIEDLFNKICEYAINYDSLELIYLERAYKMILSCDNKNVNIKNEELKEKITEEEDPHDRLPSSNRDYIIKQSHAQNLLKALGIMTKDGKIKNDKMRKFNQIDHYIELIEPLLLDLPRHGRINVLDCGCGKSYLSFALNYYMTEIKKLKTHFIGIDISEKVIESSKNIAKELNYKNMDFKKLDIREYDTNEDIHMVISLHACDTATDMALSFGVKKSSKVIIANPCCHKEMLGQYKYDPFLEILKHGILKSKLADTLTDGMRALLLEAYGYDVSVVEYISPLETPKNILIRAIKKHDINEKALEKYIDLMKILNVYPAFYAYLN